MKKILKRLGVALLAITAGASGTFAQSAGSAEPIIQFHTNLYDLNGDLNAFHFVIGAKEETYIDVDCGFGPTEVEVGQALYDEDTQSIQGTVVSCGVNSAGVVKIYGDASLIDYLDLEGCYISDISFPNLTELQVLNLCHNEFKRLDLSHLTKLEALYVDDNPMTESPMIIGANKPYLTILSASIVGDMDPAFDISSYPELRSFVGFSTPSIKHIDPTKCPKLLQLSLDGTDISSIDVSKNPSLLILNVSDTKVQSLDLSKNTQLRELYCSHNGAVNNQYKFTSLDLSKNPSLIRLFIAGNAFETIDLSSVPNLLSLSAAHNQLTSLNIDPTPNLLELDLMMNNMNFVTLPADRSTFNEYYYDQRPFVVDKQYPVGTVLDFSDKVNRPGSETSAVVYGFMEDRPSDPTLLEDDYYTWDNGKLTLNAAYTDSVYVAFKNTAFPMTVMTTTKFAVKEAEEFGKPSAVASFRMMPTLKNYALSVGLAGASEASPRTFYVDFGDGKQVACTATSNELPASPNAVSAKPTGGNSIITIYLPDGEQMTALGIANQRILTPDLDGARALQILSITGCSMPFIDLTWNKSLTKVDLSNNSLTSMDFSALTGQYEKLLLRDVNLSNNKLTSIEYRIPNCLWNVDYSNNELAAVSLTKMSEVKSLNLSGNKLTAVDLRDLEAIENLDLSDNHLTEVVLQDYLPLKSLDVRYNDMSFASMPLPGRVSDYTYAPQNEIALPEKAPVVSLYSYEFTTDAGSTDFTWYMAETGAPVVMEGNIRDNNGRFFFTNPDLGKIYCALTNPAFPDFAGEKAIRTSVVQTAPMPTNVFATFTPKKDGTGLLIMGAHKAGTAVYVDWTGEGDMEQYILSSTHESYEAPVMGGKQAKCYSYDEDEGLRVFSISCNALSSLDASKMKNLIAFMAYETDMAVKDVKLPVASPLTELSLTGMHFESEEFLKDFSGLEHLILQGDGISSFDVSSLKKLETLGFSNSSLKSIKLDNPVLWDLSLSANEFETIKPTGVPALQQLIMFSNKLTSIDVSELPNLKVLLIDDNKLTFNTLPVRQSSWLIYGYQNQEILSVEAVDGKVDLSSQASVDGQPTTYRWFIDTPYLDDDNELVGEELVEGYEYTIENGVTTFLSSQENIMCVMSNPLFPDFYLLTKFIDVEISGIENVGIEEGSNGEVEYFNLQGIRVASPGKGFYIRREGSKSTKVYLK
ncbi:MAG: hypothetical protein K2M06_06020 [Muribaculaceae bacterium]|nr:hypothetical protein [Muribaculaceae bacterium]